MIEATVHPLHVQEYLRQERQTDVRNEYEAGRLLPLPPQDERRCALLANLIGLFADRLEALPQATFASRMRIHIAPVAYYAYPDILLLCVDPIFAGTRQDTLLNPCAVMEILGDERNNRFARYRPLESLCDYIRIDPYRLRIEHFWRCDGDTWGYEALECEEDSLSFSCIPCALPLNEVYEGVILAS